MRLISKIDEIVSYAQVNKHKVKELMISGVIPAVINESTNRNFFYTTDNLIDFAAQRISKIKKTTTENYRDLFLYDDLEEILFNKKPNNCKTYVVTNQKGGVAKTTVSVNLSSTLAFLNKKVLLIDLDSQSQSSRYLNKEQYTGKSLVNVLNEILQTGNIEKDFIKQFIVQHDVVNDKYINVLPSELRLAKILELCRTASMPHTILKKIIDTIKEDYDFIIIDLPPSSGISIELALYASDKVILATDCDEFSKEGIEVTLEGIKAFNESVEKNLIIDSCFISKFNKNAKIHHTIRNESVDMLREKGFSEDKIFTILYSLVIPESQYEASPLIGFFQKETYNPKTDSVNYVSTINQSILANEHFFEYAIKMINDKEDS